MNFEYPWWFTLGGITGSQSAGSQNVALLTATLSMFMFVCCLLLGAYWYKSSLRAASNMSRKAKRDFAFLCWFGGFSGFGMRVVMIFVPAWTLMLLVLLLTDILIVIVLCRFRKISVFFESNEKLYKTTQTIKNIVSDSRNYPQESIRVKLERLVRELEGSLSNNGVS